MDAVDLRPSNKKVAQAASGGLATVRDDPLIRLWRHEGNTKRLVVCFSDIGRYDDRLPESKFNRLGYLQTPDHLLFIVYPGLTRLNQAGLIEALAGAIEDEVVRTGATRICIVGHSMEAYAAMVTQALAKVGVSVAFSSQYAADPAKVPTKTPWAEWRTKITQFRIACVADHLVSSCQYFVFHGRNLHETAKRDLVRPLSNLEKFMLLGTYPRTSKKPKHVGVCDRVLAACFSNHKQSLHNIMVNSVSAHCVGLACNT